MRKYNVYKNLSLKTKTLNILKPNKIIGYKYVRQILSDFLFVIMFYILMSEWEHIFYLLSILIISIVFLFQLLLFSYWGQQTFNQFICDLLVIILFIY
jgi:asparagine N-glycosylation enzyme membrane subunit Stt3